MSTPIASLYSKLSFRIDKRQLDRYERMLRNTHKRLNDAGDHVQKQIKKTTKTQVAGLTAVEKRLHKQRGQLWQLRQDYFKVNQEYRNGTISHERRSRLLTDINRQYRQQRNLVRSVNREVRNQPMRRLGETMRRPVRGAGASAGGSGAVKAGATAGTVGRLGVVGMAGAAALGGGFMSNLSFQRFQAVQSAFKSLEGSSEAANKRLNELAGMAQYFGSQFLPLAEGFKTYSAAIKGTDLEKTALKNFSQLTAYGTAMGLDQQSMSGIQRAIGQVAALGKLSAEEVNQLSEHGIPARAILSDALGIGQPELRERMGSTEGIAATVALPALLGEMERRATAGGALEERRASTTAEMNRAINTGVFANIAANTSGINQYFKTFYQGIQEMVEKSMPLIREIGETFESMAVPTRENLESLGEIFGAIGRMSNALDGAEIDGSTGKLVNGLQSLSNTFTEIADYFEANVDSVKRNYEQFMKMVYLPRDLLLKALGLFTDIDTKDYPSNHPMARARAMSNNTEQVDISGVKALLSSVANNPNNRSFDQYPPNHPMSRASNSYKIEAPVTIEVNGYNKDPEELTRMIQDSWESNINGLIRQTSSNQIIDEK